MDICVPSAPNNWFIAVRKDALSAFLAMHLAAASVLTDYQSHLSGDQKGKELMVPSPECRVRDVPDRPVSLLQDSVCGPSCT